MGAGWAGVPESGDAAIAHLESALTSPSSVRDSIRTDYWLCPVVAIAGWALAPRPSTDDMLRAHSRIRPPMPEFLLLRRDDGGQGRHPGTGAALAILARVRCQCRSWWLPPLSDRIRYPQRHAPGDGNALVARLFYSLAARRRRRSLLAGACGNWTVEGGKVRGVTLPSMARSGASTAGRAWSWPPVALVTARPCALNWLLPECPCLRWLCDAVNVRRHHCGAIRRRWVRALRRRRLLLAAAVARATPRWARSFPIFPGPRQAGPLLPHAQGRRFADDGPVPPLRGGDGAPPAAHRRRCGPGWSAMRPSCTSTGLGVILPGTRRLDRWIRQGYVCVADRLVGAGAARRHRSCGLSPPCSGPTTMLQLAVTRLPQGRCVRSTGSTGDPAHRPNPLPRAKSANRPSSQLRIPPADAASSSGLLIDADGRVLDRAGRAVGDLMLCGNDAAVRDAGHLSARERHWGRPRPCLAGCAVCGVSCCIGACDPIEEKPR